MLRAGTWPLAALLLLGGAPRALSVPDAGAHLSEDQRWAACGDLATCLMLESAPEVEVGVALNLVFIGFQGEGHLGLNLSRPLLERWFERLESVRPHLIVPTAGVGGGGRGGAGASDAPTGARLRVLYELELRAYELDEAVTDVLHALLRAQLRAESAELGAAAIPAAQAEGAAGPDAVFQVDALAMEAVLGSLSAHLGLDTEAYTLFLLNPARTATQFTHYGYRVGLSAEEAELVAGDRDLGRYLSEGDRARGGAAAPSLPGGAGVAVEPPVVTRAEAMRRASDALARAHEAAQVRAQRAQRSAGGGSGASGEGGGVAAAPRLEWRDARASSAEWARRALADDSAASLAPLLRASAAAGSDDAAERVRARAHAMLGYGGARARAAVRGAYAGVGPGEECLVDTWAADGRFAFVDLSAGPFHWGPVVGGEGVHTSNSLPDTHSLMQFQYVMAPAGASWGSGAGGEHFAAEAVDMGGGVRPSTGPPTLEQLEAERSVLSRTLERGCYAHGHIAERECAGLRLRLDALRRLVEDVAAARARAEAAQAAPGSRESAAVALGGRARADLAERRRWEELSAELRARADEGGGSGDGAGAGGVVDELISLEASSLVGSFAANDYMPPQLQLFLARLGATISGAIRHLWLPASSALPPGAHAASRVHFAVYHVRAGSGGGGAGRFDASALKAELAKLALPTQTFAFTEHSLALADDDTLAVAYARSLASAVVPSLSVSGEFSAQPRHFIDAHTLASLLQQRAAEAAPPGRAAPAAPSARAASWRAPPAGAARAAGAEGGAAAEEEQWFHMAWASAADSAEAARAQLRAARAPPPAAREVPIFVLTLDGALPAAAAAAGTAAPRGAARGAEPSEGDASATPSASSPVLLDRFFAAKAVGGVVLAVANVGPAAAQADAAAAAPADAELRRWPSHLACNGRHVAWDLADPTRHAVAAAAQLVGGLLPSHVGLSDGHRRRSQEWSWAVGSHALSHTSHSASLSRMHADLVGRNLIASALHESAEVVEMVVAALRTARVHGAAAVRTARAPSSEARAAARAFARVRAVQRVVSDLASRLALTEAHAALATLDAELEALRSAAARAIDELEPFRCASINQRELGSASRGDAGALALTGFLLALAGALYWRFLRARPPSKPKLN